MASRSAYPNPDPDPKAPKTPPKKTSFKPQAEKKKEVAPKATDRARSRLDDALSKDAKTTSHYHHIAKMAAAQKAAESKKNGDPPPKKKPKKK